MADRILNIISFDIPYPPDYGGVVDIYYRIKALSESGIRINLHCYEYGRKHAAELNELCENVYYYKRDKSLNNLFSTLPYIVKSRSNKALLASLKSGNDPILMEGIHTTFFLHQNELKERKVIVRSHNIEHNYYKSLAALENSFIKKAYFKSEARKLEAYEDVLLHADAIAAISPYEAIYIKRKFGNGFYLPAFHPNDTLTCLPGRGSYALYHGNLSVAENDHAALFLVNEVFNGIDVPLIIAGNRPSRELIHAIAARKNVERREITGVEQLKDLIRNAHCNILATFQSTGVKLKLINALFNGRFCIVNPPMVTHTGLEEQCVIAETPERMRQSIQMVFNQTFGLIEWEKRKRILSQFDNKKNAEMLINKIF